MSRTKPTPVESPANGDADIDTTLLTTAPDDWEFETVSEESPIGVILDKPGECFIGMFTGQETIKTDVPFNAEGDTEFDVFVFRGRDGRRYSMPQSYNLSKAMDKVQAGSWVRITLMTEIETRRGQNPMKDFRVEVKK